jgi:hypothetical protein
MRLPLPDEALLADLPTSIAVGIDRTARALIVRSSDIGVPLRELLAWADRHQLDISGLEVGPPSLEDAYLAAIGQTSHLEEPAS